MELQNRRVRLAELILGINEEALISALEKLLLISDTKRPAIKEEDLLSRLDEAMVDAKAGRTTDAEILRGEIDKWK